MIAITGANGHLGQLVVERLLERIPANQIIAAVRAPENASRLAKIGVQVRKADYSRPEDPQYRALWCKAAPANFGI